MVALEPRMKGVVFHSFLPIFALGFFVEPLEWLILVLFVHVAKPLYFRFKIALRPVNLAVLLSSLTPPPLLLHSIPLYFHFFPFFLIPISPSRAPVIISVTQSGAHFHISPPQNRDTTTLLYLSVFIQLIFHTLTSNITALCSWDNRAEH